MVNTLKKMSRSNVKSRRWMEANGYKDIFFTPHTRWSKDIIFQAKEFDGLASHGDKVVFFQIKSNCRAPKKTLRDYAKLSAVFDIECLWINCPDRKGLEINNQPAESYES